MTESKEIERTEKSSLSFRHVIRNGFILSNKDISLNIFNQEESIMLKNLKKVMNKPKSELSMLDQLYLIAVAAFSLGLVIIGFEIKEKIEDFRIKRNQKKSKKK